MSEITSTYPGDRHVDTIEAIEPTERELLLARLYHVSWGAIFLGLVLAVAIQVLLGLLGISIGAAAFDPSNPSGVGAWSVGSYIYLVIVQILSLLLGGYVASRLAPTRTSQSAIMHGASTWALSTVIMVWLGTTTAGAMIGGMSRAVASIGSTAGQAVEAVVPDNLDLNLPEISYDSLPQPVQDRLRQNGITPDNFQQELRGAYRDVVSPTEQRQIVQRLQEALNNIVQNPANAPQDIDRAVNDIVGKGAILSQRDLDQLKGTLQARLGLSDQETQQIVNDIQKGAQDAQMAIRDAINKAQQSVVQAAQTTSSQVATIAFWAFVASLLGLLAAIGGGMIGQTKDVESELI